MASQTFNHLFHGRHLEDILEPILMNILKDIHVNKLRTTSKSVT